VGSVQSLLDPAADLGRFFDLMYGAAQGYAYTATKDPESSSFHQYFYKWPQERDSLVAHCLAYTETQEVYYSPGLFRKPEATKEAFLGTYYVWCEFDGNAPDELGGVPAPSLKVQSSTSKNQHWYWRLDHFETDRTVVEGISSKIAYYAQADLGIWNANRVLRPPGTRHHESGLQVRILSQAVYPLALEAFGGLPSVPMRLASESDIGEVPAPLTVLMKYHFNEEDTGFFTTKKIEKGHRSSALTKFAHICIEKNMTNAETLSLLLNLDERWGKFNKRPDQKHMLLGIINHVRSLHPVDPVVQETAHGFKVYTYEEFINSEVELEWVIPNLVHANGSVLVSGKPGIGKSQLSLRFAEKIAKGEKFLKWQATPKKILFVSMEMPFEELNFIMKAMKFEENELLRENLLISTPGRSVRLSDPKKQDELNRIIEEFQPHGVVFDSLGKAINDDMSADKTILNTFDYIDGTLRGQYGVFTWFIHHNRKAQVGNPKPNKLDDLYGNQYIGASITTGLGLWKDKPGDPIDVSCLKLRMAPEFPSFKIRRTSDIDFSVLGGWDNANPNNTNDMGSESSETDDVVDLTESL
jgi:hypothetical protein